MDSKLLMSMCYLLLLGEQNYRFGHTVVILSCFRDGKLEQKNCRAFKQHEGYTGHCYSSTHKVFIQTNANNHIYADMSAVLK